MTKLEPTFSVLLILMYFTCFISLLILHNFGILPCKVFLCSSFIWALWSFLFANRNCHSPYTSHLSHIYSLQIKSHNYEVSKEKSLFLFLKDGSIKGPLLSLYSTPVLEIKMCILSTNFLWCAELWKCICFVKGAYSKECDLFWWVFWKIPCKPDIL